MRQPNLIFAPRRFLTGAIVCGCLIAALLAGCMSGAPAQEPYAAGSAPAGASQSTYTPQPNGRAEPNWTPWPTWTPLATPTPRPTWTPAITAEPAATLEPIPAGAAMLCNQAFDSEAVEGTPSGPAIFLLNKQYEGGAWEHAGLPHLQPPPLVQAQTLVCIRENRVLVRTYGARAVPAYLITWDVRLVRAVDGASLAGQMLFGGQPPEPTASAFEVYGSRPLRQLLAWLSPALRREGQTVFAHDEGVEGVAFSPDGSRLAAAGGEAMTLWATASGELLQTFAREGAYFSCVAYAPNGNTLATCSGDSVILWDAASGEKLRTDAWHAGSGPVRAVAFSPDGSLLASGSGGADPTAEIGKSASGELLHTLSGHGRDVTGIAFSPDGKLLATGSLDGSVKLWDVGTGQLVRSIAADQRSVLGLAFSSDGLSVASAGLETVKLWDVTSGRELRVLAHPGWVTCAAFSRDGKWLVSGDDDGVVRVWELAGGQLSDTLLGHTGRVTAVAFSPNGKSLASASDDTTVRLWKVGE